MSSQTRARVSQKMEVSATHSSARAYRSCLTSIFFTLDVMKMLHEPGNLNFGALSSAEGWKKCTELITPEVLKEAHSFALEKAKEYRHLLQKEGIAGVSVTPRAEKSIERIKQKALKGDHFKVNSDLSAIRISASIESMPAVIRLLRRANFVVERNSVLDPDTGKLADIAAYFFDLKGLVTEIQVVHPFAELVFKRDSFLRDNPDSGLVDYWKSKSV